MTTTYVVDGKRLADGFMVREFPLALTRVLDARLNDSTNGPVAEFVWISIVPAFLLMFSLYVAMRLASRLESAEPCAGLHALRVGGVVSTLLIVDVLKE